MTLDTANYTRVMWEHGWMRGVCHIHWGRTARAARSASGVVTDADG